MEFHLSGVALNGPWGNLFVRVPWNEEKAILGDPCRSPKAFVEAYYGRVTRARIDFKRWYWCHWDEEPVAYPIHERCWVLLERIIRAKRGESLGLLIQALNAVLTYDVPCGEDPPGPMTEEEEEEFYQQRTDGATWIIPEDHEWEELEKTHGEALYQDISKYLPAHNQRMNDPYQRRKSFMAAQFHEIEEYYMPRDPLNVTEVRDMIKVATESPSGYQARHRRPESSNQMSSVWSNVRLRYRNKESWDRNCRNEELENKEPLVDLPLDIIYMIVAYLQHPDICNTLRAFRWQLPNSVWRSLFPKDIIFEYEEIKAAENLDWRQLYFRAHGLLKTSDGLKNRVRIMKILTAVKSVFLQLLKENNITY